jgi:PIN domain nuclease of toxin-antitoxin system
MRLLLDTHILLWALVDDRRLSSGVREMLLDPSNDVFFSAASVWEIAVKRSLRRGDIPVSAKEAVRLFGEAGYEELGISVAHAVAVEALPSIHADPFDRLLVAQALSEPMRLITHDHVVASYGESIFLV